MLIYAIGHCQVKILYESKVKAAVQLIVNRRAA